MKIKLKFWIALVAACVAVGALSTIAVAARYCDPLGNCKASLKVSPRTVKVSRTVTLHGSVGQGCHVPGQVTIYSRAFKGATSHSFAGVPAVFARANRNGAFSKNVTIKRSIKHGSYHVGARCGGGNLGSAKLKVS
jgi:hypothetical protein